MYIKNVQYIIDLNDKAPLYRLYYTVILIGCYIITFS